MHQRHRLNQRQLAPSHIRRQTIDDIRAEIIDMHRVLGPQHLPRADIVHHALLFPRKRLLHGLQFLLQAFIARIVNDGSHFLQDGGAGLWLHAVPGVGAEVDGLGELGLGEGGDI